MPVLRGARRVSTGLLELRRRKCGSFMVHATEGTISHDIEIDLILLYGGGGNWSRAAISLVERDVDGETVIQIVDASERPVAKAGHPVAPDDILGTQWEMYTRMVWQAIRRAL